MKLNRPDQGTRGLMFVLACGAALIAPQVRADVVISNLDQPHLVTNDFTTGDVTTGLLVGAAIVTGNVPFAVTNVILNEENLGPPSDGESFAIYTRKGDGTLGDPLFTNFTLVFTPTNTYNGTKHGGFETATPTSAVTLAANTGYWLVLSENVPGNKFDVAWDYTHSTTYTSNPNYNVTIPTTNATVYRDNSGVDTYLNLADGPQLFQISVPEPSPLVLGSIVSGVTGFGYWWRKRRLAA